MRKERKCKMHAWLFVMMMTMHASECLECAAVESSLLCASWMDTYTYITARRGGLVNDLILGELQERKA